MSLDVFFAAIIIAALSLCLVSRFLTKTCRIIFTLAIFILVILPYPYSVAEYVLSYLSSFSISTVCIACFAILCRIKDKPCAFEQQKSFLYGLILLCALFLYPSALGAFSWDLYAVGYSNNWLTIGLLLLAVVSLVFGYYLISLIVGMAFIAYAFDWLISDNLWDYLVDPFISSVAAYVILRKLICFMQEKKIKDEG